MKFDVGTCATARCTSRSNYRLNGYLSFRRAYRQIVRTASAQSCEGRSVSPLPSKTNFNIGREMVSTGSQLPVTYAL